MGHYYSEMCCPDCKNIPCACPEKQISADNRYIVELNSYLVLSADHAKRYNIRRDAKIFDSRQEAQEGRLKLIQDELNNIPTEIARLEKRAVELKALLDRI